MPLKIENKKNYILLLLISFFATFLRLFIGNNYIISTLGSFFFGFIVERRMNSSKKMLFLTGFCACFTSFSSFIYFLYHFINQGDFVNFFLNLNMIIIFNLITMYIGFSLSRKIN